MIETVKHRCGYAMKDGKKGRWCPWCWANEEVHGIQEGRADDEDRRTQATREAEEVR